MANILIIQGKEEDTKEIEKILEGDVKINVISPESAPKSIEHLQKYDAFVISNVSAERLNDEFIENLEISVRHMGKGLLVTGEKKVTL